VDSAFLSVDKDLSVCESLSIIQPNIFANGGDRTLGEIPETKVMKEFGIKMIDGLGSKIRSSSELTGLKAK
jgi:D-beta-D-heptose 7-phosphate kinase/D-beta-D-heptose 1-phosphate adenosyltransferase